MLTHEIEKLKGMELVAELLWMLGLPPQEHSPDKITLGPGMHVARDGESMTIMVLNPSAGGFFPTGPFKDGRVLVDKLMEMMGLDKVAHHAHKEGENFSTAVKAEEMRSLTIRQTIEQMCFKCGMFESQCAAVAQMAIASIEASRENDGYQIQWDSPNDFPPLMGRLWFETHVKPCALRWIDHVMPQAWYRPMFLPKEEQDAIGKENAK